MELFWFVSHNQLAYLRTELKTFLYHLRIARRRSEIDQEDRVAYVHLIKEKLKEYPNISRRIIFPDQYSLLPHSVQNKQSGKIWGTKRPGTVYAAE